MKHVSVLVVLSEFMLELKAVKKPSSLCALSWKCINLHVMSMFGCHLPFSLETQMIQNAHNCEHHCPFLLTYMYIFVPSGMRPGCVIRIE